MHYTNEHIILKKLSGNPAEEASIDELLAITNKYPAFGAGKYLLAKKMQQQQHEGFQQEAQNAVLYFTNPFWFHFKLNEESLMADQSFLPKKETGQQAALQQVVKTKTVVPAEAVELPAENALGDDIETEAVDAEPIEAIEGIGMVDAIILAEDEEAPKAEAIEIAIPTERPEEVQVTEESAPIITETQTQAEDLVGQPEAHVVDEVVFVESATEHTTVDEFGDEDAIDEEETALPPLSNDKISAILDEQLAEFKKPITEDTPVPIESEPYHTVDYFDSQGIRLTKEQQQQDHLSVKVKKFTDWLKQMKRISPQPADLGIDEAAESKVQHSAERSNKVKEVVTEAMAEVLAKQGMNAKAIEIYEKLSFLYPAKSAYFAIQIEHLKEK